MRLFPARYAHYRAIIASKPLIPRVSGMRPARRFLLTRPGGYSSSWTKRTGTGGEYGS